jgi:hypothetical protein
MYKKLSLSIALYGLLITPLSPLGVYESYNIVDFVNRNFETDDQSKPNLVKTHYPLSYQSPNILTNIEGVPNLDTQSKVSVEVPKYLIKVIRISPYYPYPTPEDESVKPIYIVKQVRVMSPNGQSGKVLY